MQAPPSTPLRLQSSTQVELKGAVFTEYTFVALKRKR